MSAGDPMVVGRKAYTWADQFEEVATTETGRQAAGEAAELLKTALDVEGEAMEAIEA